MECFLPFVVAFCVLLDHGTCASEANDEIVDIAQNNVEQLVDSILNIGNVIKQQYNIIGLAKNASEDIEKGNGKTEETTKVTTQTPCNETPKCDALLTLHSVDPSSYPGCTQEYVQSCLKAEVNITLLMNGNRIAVPGGACMDLVDRCQNYAVFKSLRGEEAVFSWDNKTISGNINTNNGSYSLEGCKGCTGKPYECFLLIQYNTSNLEDPEPFEDDESNESEICRGKRQAEVTEQKWADRRDELQAKGEADNTTIVTYSVMIWTTLQFDEAFATTQDRDLFIENAILLTNLGYTNSKMPVRVKLHDIKTHELNDTDLTNKSRNFIQYWEHRQTRNCADSAVLLMYRGLPGKCGLAFGTAYKCKTFGIVLKACATHRYSLGHELGHMFGAKHNREVYNETKIEGDKYGYHLQPGLNGNRARTILAYPKKGVSLPRVNYYSNPDVIYPGTNTPTGVIGEANNARKISSNRFLMDACETKESDDLCDLPTE